MSYLSGKLIVDVLAKVEIKNTFEGTAIATFKGQVNCIKNEMFDQYEYIKLDVSEYDYEIKEVKPIENNCYYLIKANGDIVKGKSEIIKVLEVFEYEIISEEF